MYADEAASLHDAIKSARKIQDFLWEENNNKWSLEEWKRMFRKRIVKINNIDVEKPHSIVELKKRLLQNAALSIALLGILQYRIPANKEQTISSNLDEYKLSDLDWDEEYKFLTGGDK